MCSPDIRFIFESNSCPLDVWFLKTVKRKACRLLDVRVWDFEQIYVLRTSVLKKCVLRTCDRLQHDSWFIIRVRQSVLRTFVLFSFYTCPIDDCVFIKFKIGHEADVCYENMYAVWSSIKTRFLDKGNTYYKKGNSAALRVDLI